MLPIARKLIRERFGITARRVTIRSDLPVGWRIAVLLGVVAVAAVGALNAYREGMLFAGFNRSASISEIDRLRSELANFQGELERLRTEARSMEGRFQVEMAVQGKMASQVAVLQRENAALKEEIAMFEGLMAEGTKANGIRITHATIEALPQSGRYRFRVFVANSGALKLAREISGEVRLELLVEQDRKPVNISFPSSEKESTAYRFSIRHFQRIVGELSIPERAVLKSGEVRLLLDGSPAGSRRLSF